MLGCLPIFFQALSEDLTSAQNLWPYEVKRSYVNLKRLYFNTIQVIFKHHKVTEISVSAYFKVQRRML